MTPPPDPAHETPAAEPPASRDDRQADLFAAVDDAPDDYAPSRRGPAPELPDAPPVTAPAPAAPIPAAPVPVVQAFADDVAGHRRKQTSHTAKTAAAREVSSTGLSPRVAGVLCYAAGWASGLVLLSMERQSPFVRFHAYQAVMAFGGLTLIAVGCWAFTIVMAFFSPGAFRVMAVVTQIAWIALAATWLFAVIEVSQGKRRKLPLVGKRAERVAAALPMDG